MELEWGSPSPRHGMLKVQAQTVVSHSCIPGEAEVSPEGRASFPRKNLQDIKEAKWFLGAPIAFHWLHRCLNGWCVTLCSENRGDQSPSCCFCVKSPVGLCTLFPALCPVHGNPGIHKDKCFISLWVLLVVTKCPFQTFIIYISLAQSYQSRAWKCCCLVVKLNTSNVMDSFKELTKNPCSVGLCHCLKINSPSTESPSGMACSKNVYK